MGPYQSKHPSDKMPFLGEKTDILKTLNERNKNKKEHEKSKKEIMKTRSRLRSIIHLAYALPRCTHIWAV